MKPGLIQIKNRSELQSERRRSGVNPGQFGSTH